MPSSGVSSPRKLEYKQAYAQTATLSLPDFVCRTAGSDVSHFKCVIDRGGQRSPDNVVTPTVLQA